MTELMDMGRLYRDGWDGGQKAVCSLAHCLFLGSS